MKNRKYLIAISWVLGIFFAASCKKDLAPVVSDKTAKLTFFNTSYELNALLTGNQSFIPIFWDTVDSSFNWGLHYGYSSPPQFNRTNWNLQFPNYNMGDYAQPGQAYWQIRPAHIP